MSAFVSRSEEAVMRRLRWLAVAVFVAVVLAISAVVPWSGASAASPSPSSSATRGGYLLVADPAATTVYVYSLPDLTLTGQLDDLEFGAHNGSVTLADGRVLFSDSASGAIKVVTIDDAGVPAVVASVPVWDGNQIVWSSIDPEGRYLLAAGQLLDSATQVFNIVDLATYTNTPIQVPMGADEEVVAWLDGDPTTVFVSQGGRVDTYPLADLLAGGTPTPAGSVAIELGSHGGVADPERDQFMITTTAGFEVVDVSKTTPAHTELIPWDVDGFTGGQNYRPRLAPDGDHVVGVLTAPPATPEEWATAEVTAHIADLGTLEASRVALGTGRFAGRWGISEPYALFAGTDGVTGTAHLLDVNATSATFGTVVATIPLDMPTKGALPGGPTTGTEGYLTTITPDGSQGFVVHGGDGVISVIDTAAGAVSGTITVPTSMDAAGYATVISPGLAPVDLFAR